MHSPLDKRTEANNWPGVWIVEINEYFPSLDFDLNFKIFLFNFKNVFIKWYIAGERVVLVVVVADAASVKRFENVIIWFSLSM